MECSSWKPPTRHRNRSRFELRSFVAIGVFRMVFTVGTARGTRALADVHIDNDSSGTAVARGRWPRSFSMVPDTGTRANVTMLFDDRTRELTLVLGNRGLRWTDSGVMLEVFTVDADVIVGRWVDGGLTVDAKSGLHPQGWFCLER